MQETQTNVLKGSEIRFGPPRRLGAAAGAQRPAGCSHAAAGQQAGASARIVDQTADRVIIEVICPCGNAVHVECQGAGEEV